jgi:hypothetical protein
MAGINLARLAKGRSYYFLTLTNEINKSNCLSTKFLNKVCRAKAWNLKYFHIYSLQFT